MPLRQVPAVREAEWMVRFPVRSVICERAVRDRVPCGPRFGTVSVDLVWGEETIVDALAERVRVDGLAKILDVGNLPGFLGCGGETDLGGGGEVIEHLAPIPRFTVLPRTSTRPLVK